MNARRVPSSAAMRSRCARTTSTGETCLVAIMRPRSAIDIQQSSLTSQHPVLRRRLDVAEIGLVQALEPLEQTLDRGTDRLELGLAPVEPGEHRRALEPIHANFHAREHTTRM